MNRSECSLYPPDLIYQINFPFGADIMERKRGWSGSVATGQARDKQSEIHGDAYSHESDRQMPERSSLTFSLPRMKKRESTHSPGIDSEPYWRKTGIEKECTSMFYFIKLLRSIMNVLR
jgi:hypothetical protein